MLIVHLNGEDFRIYSLDGIVAVFCWDHSTAVFHINESELKRFADFAPEVVVWDKLEAARSEEEIIDENSDEKIKENDCQEHDEELVEHSVVGNLIDLL